MSGKARNEFGQFFNAECLVKRFIDLVRIDSLSGEEEKISLYLAAEFEKLGCGVIRDAFGNVVAHYPDSGKFGTVMFCAYMDTVGKEYGIQPIIEDGIIAVADMIRSVELHLTAALL